MSKMHLLLITRMDALKMTFSRVYEAACVIAGIATVVGILAVIALDFQYENLLKIVKLWGYYGLPIFILMTIINIFIPTMKEYLAIMGISAVTENEQIVNNTNRLIDATFNYINKLTTKLEVNSKSLGIENKKKK